MLEFLLPNIDISYTKIFASMSGITLLLYFVLPCILMRLSIFTCVFGYSSLAIMWMAYSCPLSTLLYILACSYWFVDFLYKFGK